MSALCKPCNLSFKKALLELPLFFKLFNTLFLNFCYSECIIGFFLVGALVLLTLRNFELAMASNTCLPIALNDIKSRDCSGVASLFSKKLYNPIIIPFTVEKHTM